MERLFINVSCKICAGKNNFTRDKQVTYIKIEARRGKSAIEIQKALEALGSEFVLPYSSITGWVRQFNNAQNTVCNKHLCGRPLSAMTGENVENVAKLLSDDRRYSCNEIAHELVISHGSVYQILTKRLQMRKITARWVPYMLLESEKHQRVNIARKLRKDMVKMAMKCYKESLQSMRHGFGLLNSN